MAKILIIDDDADFTAATKAILEAAGHQVATAPDGKAGLARVKEFEPKLIVLDIMMDSVFEGFSVTSALRGTPEYMDYRDIPILMVSAVKNMTGSRFEVPKDARITQGDQFLDKPFRADALLEKVGQMLGA